MTCRRWLYAVDSKKSVDTLHTGQQPVPLTKPARKAGSAAILAAPARQQCQRTFYNPPSLRIHSRAGRRWMRNLALLRLTNFQRRYFSDTRSQIYTKATRHSLIGSAYCVAADGLLV